MRNSKVYAHRVDTRTLDVPSIPRPAHATLQTNQHSNASVVSAILKK